MVKFREKIALYALAVLTLFGSAVFAEVRAEGNEATSQQQQSVLRGQVSDDAGPIMGASVSVKGKNIGTTTDVDGNFVLNGLSRGDVIVIAFLGYAQQEITYTGQQSLDVVMKEDEQALDEVVVTALGIKRDTRALGYSVSTIKGDDMIKAGITANPIASLYGKAAGVGIQATAAGPMGGMKINIRGAQGLESSSGTRPLFVVDGVPVYDTESSMASRDYNPLNSFDYGSATNDINVEDIASMEILKGAKAAVLYGSAGANGVVLITTKSGAGTRGLGVQVSYGQEWHEPYSLIDFQNEYGSGENEYSYNWEDANQTIRRTVSSRFNFGPKFDGSPIKFFDGSTRTYSPYKNNYLDLFNTGASHNVQGAIQGGNERSNMRLSFTNYQYDGITPNQEQTKNTLSFNGQIEVSKLAKFEFTQNLYYTNSQNRMSNIQHLIAWGTFNRDYDIKTAMNSYKDETGWMRTMSELGSVEGDGWGWPSAFLDPNNINDGFFNMMWNMNENRNTDTRLHTITSGKATFTFLPFLSLTLQGGLDYTDTDYATKNMPYRQNADGSYTGGKFSFERERNMIQNYEAYIRFDKKFIDDKLNVFAFAGPAYKKTSYTDVNVGTRGNSKFAGFWSLSNADTWPASYDSYVSGYSQQYESMYSVLGQGTVSWGMEYILEFQARNDWSSTLPKANRSYFYPGASLTWNFTERYELPVINYGKLFVSWADVGRPATRYYALKTYSMGTLPAPNTFINDITGPSDLFSGDLKPERKREYEVGTSLRMFKNRLEFNASYYNATWYNQIMGVPLSSTTGSQNIRINAGEINNQGIELYLNGAIIATEPFRWEMTLTAAKQWDKINKLYPGITQKQESAGNLLWRKAEGERMNTLWIQDYARDENGNRLVNDNGLYYLSTDPDDEICLGSTNTDIYGGLSTNFYFKGNWGMLNLMGALDYKFGGYVLSYSNFYLQGNGLTTQTLFGRDAEHGGIEWTETLADGSTRVRHDGIILPGMKADGTANDKVISAYQYYATFIHDMGTGWQPDMIQENSYIKFREAALTYTFPAKIAKSLKLQKLAVGLTARNLFYIYKSIDNIDSEAMLGTGSDSWRENSNFPSLRSYGFKINVSF
ncbi:MAG: SusC/RagA family TonB-linked outer membrane protein [Dysgonamonadaceae bacterium]|jgi:iron complex outermembrane receptor protein|nr:SusC/RagA family TonB-linked outer membrane protein [Dysgonamonadaceae bacterium]